MKIATKNTNAGISEKFVPAIKEVTLWQPHVDCIIRRHPELASNSKQDTTQIRPGLKVDAKRWGSDFMYCKCSPADLSITKSSLTAKGADGRRKDELGQEWTKEKIWILNE